MIKIYLGDSTELASKILDDKTVDLIFTDPPYLKKYIPYYEWLAKEANRVLKPNGFLITYVGSYWKDDVMAIMRNYLDYFWNFVIENEGKSSIHWQRKIISRHKDLLVYRPKNGNGLPVCNVLSLWRGGGEDKRYHIWGQDESSARYFIDVFSKPGDIVVDFFLGGGTTGIVCKKLNRKFIGFEIDKDSYQIAKKRILESYVPNKNNQLSLFERI